MIAAATLLLFAAASIPLILLPGPSVLYILTTTLRHGRRHGILAALGIESGYVVQVAACVLGLSAVIAAGAEVFTVVKLAGAGYLLYLAWRSWRARTPGTLADLAEGAPAAAASRSYLRAVPVGVLNPKTALFYLAFLPQFVRPDAGPSWVQLLVLGLLFVAMATVLDCLWALAGSAFASRLHRVRAIVLERVSAGVMVVLAGISLTARRAVG